MDTCPDLGDYSAFDRNLTGLQQTFDHEQLDQRQHIGATVLPDILIRFTGAIQVRSRNRLIIHH